MKTWSKTVLAFSAGQTSSATGAAPETAKVNHNTSDKHTLDCSSIKNPEQIKKPALRFIRPLQKIPDIFTAFFKHPSTR
jgi:hypothetical protein